MAKKRFSTIEKAGIYGAAVFAGGVAGAFVAPAAFPVSAVAGAAVAVGSVALILNEEKNIDTRF